MVLATKLLSTCTIRLCLLSRCIGDVQGPADAGDNGAWLQVGCCSRGMNGDEVGRTAEVATCKFFAEAVLQPVDLPLSSSMRLIWATRLASFSLIKRIED